MLSERELKLIQRAEARVKQAVVFRLMAIVIALVLIALFFLGYLNPEELAFSAFGLALLSVVAPQLGGTPKYEELVAVLAKQRKQQQSS
ncbi:hypothetical protein JF535_04245 [Microbulbifer salipaludis]|uniref:Uncharacterized protein n=2 Tax=Microbulbifer salipaludis TaxID=187980 RepID=A0ABS3E444_9GAMM|nr:hypothetical protein [Microbulbifer salipaludis]